MPLNNQIIVPKYIATSGVYQETVLTPSEINAYSSNNPSGFITGVDLSNYATKSNLQLTGQNLQSQINNLSNSGFITGVDLSSYATTTNLASTGSTLAGNLASTGSTLDTKINSLSGNLTSNYATITNLGSTGSTLAGNLASTGSTLNTRITNLSGYINSSSSNIVFTTGNQIIGGYKLISGGVSSVLQVGGYSPIGGYSDGAWMGASVLRAPFIEMGANASSINDLLGFVSSPLNLRTSQVFRTSAIDFLNNNNVLFTSGNQIINGIKRFNNEVYIKDLYVTGTQTIVNTTSTNVASNYLLLNATGGARDAGIFIVTGLSSGTSGTALTGTNDLGAIIGYDVPANQWVFGTTTRNSDLSTLAKIASTTDITNYSGFVDNKYYSKDNPSGFITGVDLSNYATITNLALTGSTLATNLDTTGSTLNTKINNLSGYINSSGSNIVFTTGNQTINGQKNFTSNPTVNTIPVLLSGDPVDLIHLYGKNNVGTTIYKGQPVYINSAAGANPLIKLASNTGDSSSAQTIGLLAQNLGVNEFGYIVTQGILEGFNTSDAADGDPIWLGPTGTLLYGMANKPHAPSHLVYLGTVLRSQNVNGKVYVKPQNGYEIEELHDVRIINPQNNDIIIYNTSSGLWLNSGVNFNNFYTKDNPSGFITGIDLSNYATTSNLELTGQNLQLQLNNKANLTNIYNAAVEWTTNHTLVDGTRYLAGDLVYVSGKIYKANFDNESIPVTSALYWTDLGAGYRLNIDGRDIPNIPVSTAIQEALNGKYSITNPSGFITGIDLSPYVTKSNGQFNDRPTVNGTGILLSGEAAQLPDTIVYTTGNNVISGDNTFYGDQYIFSGADIIVSGGTFNLDIRPVVNGTGVLLSGEAAQLPETIVYTTNDQSITGLKTFRSGIRIGDASQISTPTIQIYDGANYEYSTFYLEDAQLYINSINRTLYYNFSKYPTGTTQTIAVIKDIENYTGFATITNLASTGSTLDTKINNLSGNSILVFGNQTISGQKTFISGLTLLVQPTGTNPTLNITGTWNNTGQVYTGIFFNIIDSGSNSNSLLIDLKSNNINRFSVSKIGSMTINAEHGGGAATNIYGHQFSPNANSLIQSYGIFWPSTYRLDGGYGLYLNDGAAIGWAAGNLQSPVANLELRRDNNGILAQRSGLNPQQFRVYNLTGTNIGEFGVFGWQATGTGIGQNILVIGAQATQSGILRDVALSGRNIRIPTGDLYIGTTGAGTSRIYFANPVGGSFGSITPNQYNLSIGGGQYQTLTIDANYILTQGSFSIGNGGYLFAEGTNRYIGLRDTYSNNDTIGTNNQGFNIYKIYSGITNNFATREFLTLGWTGTTGIIGTRIGTSGTLRDLIITGGNIIIGSSGIIIPNPVVPTSTGSVGTRGQMSWDNDFIYVCVSGNSWKRSALTTW